MTQHHMTPQEANALIHDLEKRARVELKHHWRAYAFEGAFLVAIGIAAALSPSIASIAVDVFIGWLLFVTGALGLVARLYNRAMPAFWTGLLLSLVTMALGVMLAIWPVPGVITLTMALTAFFIVHGVAMLITAFSIRTASSNWLALLLSALVDFILAGLVLSQWPETASWLLGLYFGLNLIFSGLGLFFAALGARSAPDA